MGRISPAAPPRVVVTPKVAEPSPQAIIDAEVEKVRHSPPRSFASPERATKFAAALAGLLQKRTTLLTSPSQIVAFAKAELGERSQRLAIGGYFLSPTKEHYHRANAFTEGLVKRLDPKNVAIVTSDTTKSFADGTASTDYMSTMIAQQTGAKAFYVTSLSYAPRLDVSELPTPASQRQWANTPHFVLPTAGDYGTAAMTASNALIVTGGRNASVSDFVKTIARGSKAVLMVDRGLQEPAWDQEVARPGDATTYLTAMLGAAKELKAKGLDASVESAYPFPFMPSEGLDGAFLKGFAGQVLTVELTDAGSLGGAIEQSAAFLEGKGP